MRAVEAERRRSGTDDNSVGKETFTMNAGTQEDAHMWTTSPTMPKKSQSGSADRLPLMYTRVREKTIWTYWWDAKSCPDSSRCRLPGYLQLCKETSEKNKGSFDHILLHMDTVLSYVSEQELPLQWFELGRSQQRDAVMNAVLSRYGGVALDITSVLFRPLDDHWQEMVEQGATFRGYMYRLNGMPYRSAKVIALGFLMTRRDGIFSSAVRNQVVEGFAGGSNQSTCSTCNPSLGDQTLLPILSTFEYKLPKCYEDHTVDDKEAKLCPEHSQPAWYSGLSGSKRNDMRMLLRDPRDGPELPFSGFPGVAGWRVANTTKPLPYARLQMPDPHLPGGPMAAGSVCDSMQACWNDIFLRRYKQPAPPGQARLLSFVALSPQSFAGLEHRSRQQCLADKGSYFHDWLKLAGHPMH